MKYWYSRNTKLLFRTNSGNYGSSSSYYGYLYNGEEFKDIQGNTYTYYYGGGSSWSTSSEAVARIFSSAFEKITANGLLQSLLKCCKDTTFDDSKYAIDNEVTGLTISVASSYPGSKIITVSNSTDQDKTINALIKVDTPYMSNQSVNRGSTQTLIFGGILFEEDITIPAGGAYTITVTV